MLPIIAKLLISVDLLDINYEDKINSLLKIKFMIYSTFYYYFMPSFFKAQEKTDIYLNLLVDREFSAMLLYIKLNKKYNVLRSSETS